MAIPGLYPFFVPAGDFYMAAFYFLNKHIAGNFFA